MDTVDQAQQFEQSNLEQSLKVQRSAAKYIPKLVPKGYCLNFECGELFDNELTGRLYCGPVCAGRHTTQLQLMKDNLRK